MNQADEIEVFYWPTPNCFKVTILLEELAVAAELRDDAAFSSDRGREILFGRDSGGNKS